VLEVAVSHRGIQVKGSIFDVLIEFEVARALVDSLPSRPSEIRGDEPIRPFFRLLEFA
jgi:hypothetical protein